MLSFSIINQLTSMEPRKEEIKLYLAQNVNPLLEPMLA